MWRGFNVRIHDKDLYNQYYSIGKSLYDKQTSSAKDTLDRYCNADGSLNASEMEKHWFPLIKADIFISHSHRNKKLAISLAGFISNKFGLSSFIDSCIWGYSDELLKMIDDECCKDNPPHYDKDNPPHYDYDKRNRSTSHVHMMLSAALSMMIDKTECLFFLNTPQSIKPREVINEEDNITNSAWIYSELTISKLIRKKKPGRMLLIKKGSRLDEATAEWHEIEHKADLTHLKPITQEDLNDWARKRQSPHSNESTHSLDILYGHVDTGR